MSYLTCAVCGKKIDSDVDSYFVLHESAVPDETTVIAKADVNICSGCAETTTLMEMYLSGKIGMSNSPDDVIISDGIVVGYSNEASPEEVEKFFTSDEPTFTN